jgi:hypothetical protein
MRGTVRRLVIVPAVLVGAMASARAQDRPAAEFNGGAVSLDGNYDRSRSNGPLVDEGLAQEKIRLGMRGYVYDSAFFSYSLDGTAGLYQRYTGPDNAGLTDVGSWGGGGHGVLFAGHAIQLRVDVLRTEGQTLTTEWAALQHLKETTQQEGVGLDFLKFRDFTASANYRHLDTTVEGFGPTRESIHDQVDANIRQSGSPIVRSELDYLFDDGREKSTGFRETLNNINFVNSVTPNPWLSFGTTARYWLEQGQIVQDLLTVGESVNLILLPRDEVQSLISTSTYGLDMTTQGGTSMTNTVSETLTHQLFLSLTTSATGHYSITDGGDAQDYGAGLSVAYSKNVPIGTFGLSYAFAFEESADYGLGARQALRESHVLTTGTMQMLAHPDLDPSSVVVSDSAATTFYTVNLDYVLVSRGAFTEIVRIPTGTIAEGATVLVSYSYTVPDHVVIDTFSQSWSATYAVGFLSLYYRGSYGHSVAVAGDGSGLYDTSIETVGGQVAVTGGLGEFRVTNETSDVDLGTAQYLITRSDVTLTYNVNSWLTATASATDSRTWFRQPRSFTRSDAISGSVAGRYGRFLVRLLGAYGESTATGVKSDTFRVRADAETHFGDTSVKLWGEYDRGSYSQQREWVAQLGLSIERRF